jgi:hypothetical protein
MTAFEAIGLVLATTSRKDVVPEDNSRALRDYGLTVDSCERAHPTRTHPCEECMLGCLTSLEMVLRIIKQWAQKTKVIDERS